MSFGFAASSVPRRPGVARRAILSALAALLVVLGLPLLSVTSAHAAPNSLEIDKTVDNATPSPGQTFTYTIQVRCSEDDCLDAQITDQFPAELDGFEIQDVSFSPNASNVPRVVTWSTGADEPTTLGPDTQLTVDLQQVTDSPVGVGLKAGQTYRIQVSIKVPDDYGPPGTSPEIINTAAVSASNANTKTDNAIIQIETPIDIAVAVDKAWTPNRQDFDPGATSTIELDARNTSNVAVDQIVVQEPKTAPDGASSLQASNPFTITDFTGFSGTSLPAGCTDVKVDAYVFANGTWSWIEGDAVPAPTLALPNGVANGDVGGVRITCLGEIEQGESLSFGLDLEQRATHRNDGGDLSLDTHTVDNIATGSVTMDDDTVADDGNATYTVVPLIPSVEASKNIAPGRITAGQSSAATISATNGNTPVVSMHIEDLDFFTADVTFGGFDGPLTWPAAADSATVTYHLLDGGTETITVSQGQVPAPPSGDISGFEIDWTGAIRANETGGAGFTIDTSEEATGGAPEVDLTNSIDVGVEASNGLRETAEASDGLEIVDPNLEVTLEKTVRPSNAVNPGQSVIASLEANATAIGDGAILDEILVEDVWAGDCGGFWNAFDIAGLAPTQVPADTTLTLRVQDTAGSWHDVSTYGPEGAATVHQISASDFAAALAAAGLSADDVVGVQVGFTDPSGLPSDTTVVPNLVFEARGDLRDPDCAAPPLDTEVTYVNTATAAAAGESEGGKPLAADDEDTAQGIVEIPSTAPGPMDIDKAWNKASVFAQSGEQANTSLRWNVGEGFSPVTITDMSDPAGAGYDVADEVFDAFDLFAVNLILPSSDPYSTGWFLKYDTVTKVELFNDETSTWEEVTAPGGSWMTANRGFKGHDLTAPERRTTIGVRVTLEETAADTAAREAAQQPGAGFDAFAPKPGTGVGSGSADRVFDLTWQVRDKLRSDGSFVVQEQTYNTADESVVNNTVTLTGDPIGGGASVTDRDSDTILIIDPEPLVEVSKSVDPTSDIFTPPVGTPAADYPTATWSITGNNASVGRASYVRLTDPAVCTDTTLADCQTDGDVAGATGDPFDTSRDWLTQSSNPNPFERFDATGIMIAASEPDQVDLDATTVWLLHHNGGTYTTTQHTATEVTAMSATDLADVVGISVTFQDTDPATSGGTITQPNDLTIVIESQLRATYRSSGDDLVLAAGQTEEQTNRVFAQSYDPITSPGTKTGDVAHATAELTGGVVNILPSKSISPQQITQPQHDVDDDNVTVTVGANQGAGPRSTLSPQQVVIEDQADSPEFWNAFDFTGLGSVTLPAGADQVQVDLFDGTDWIPGTPSADGLPLPGGVANADVQGIRFTFSRADGALFSGTVPAPNWSAAAVFTANLRETYRDDPSAPVVLDPDNPIHNTQTSQSTRPDGNDSEAKAADAEVTFYAGTQEIAVRKVTNEGDRLASPGDAVPFDLTLRNTGTGYLTVTDLVDVLPAELVYTGDPEPIFTPDPGGSLSDQVTVTPSADGTTIVFTWPDGGNIMEPGEEFGIRLFLELQPGLGAGETAVNEITVTTEEELSRCTNVESGGSTTGAWNEDAHTCGTTDYIGTVIGPNLYTAKGVRGSLPGAYRPGSPEFACAQNLRATGGAYYRPACVANSQVGGTDEWVLHTVNSGTVDLAEMTVFDQLPVAGDKSLVSGDGRDSAYRPQVVADSVQVTAPAGTSYVVQVTTDADVCVGTWDDLPNQPACEQSGESWVDADAGTDWSKVSGLRVVLDFAGTQAGALRAGEFVDVNFSTLNVLENDDDVSGSSRVVPADDQIAWNQHGVKFRYATETRWRQIAPSKVGVHLRVGSIQVTKEVTGPASGYAPGEFLVDLACRVGTGADAEELDLGADAVLELNGGNGHTYRVDGIPLSEQGTTCTFAEQGEVGEFGETTRAGDPSTVAVIQPTDPSRPIADQGVPSTQITTITNDYQFTGLSLTKLVDTEATDVDFGPFAFTVACVTGTGVPVTVDADGNTEFSFELEDGGTWTAPADTIPVGSVCTVTETDSDAADHRVYVGDNVVDNGDGSATVTPGVDPAAVQVTNGYEAGTFTLEKVVDGDGAARYGTGEFGFDVVCTYQDQTPYDGQVSLRAGDTITIGPYPIGTVCQVEEVVTGGATTVMMGSWDGVVTIPAPEVDGELSTVTQQATNTFDLTSLEVEKVVEGNLDARGAKGPFRVALECTWLVDGERVAFDVPGGAERVLRKSNHYSASYQDLPSSAVCVLEETEDGDAKRTAIVADIAGETVKAKGTEIEVDLSTTTGPGEATAVVTNTFLPFDKDEDGDEDRDGLPDTGAPFSPVHALLALLLLAAGGALMTRRRT